MSKSKKWVAILGGLVILTLAILLENNYTNNAVETCINSGQEVKICEELRK